MENSDFVSHEADERGAPTMEEVEEAPPVEEEQPQADKDATKYAYEAMVHLPGEDQPKKVKLTAKDLDPTQDEKLSPLFEMLTDSTMKSYFDLPTLRGLQNYMTTNKKNLAREYSNYKKKGRL